MQMRNDAKAELASDMRKADWVKPEILAVTPIAETRGNGVAGFDFGSEQTS